MILLGLIFHHTILRSLFNYPRTKQDGHSLATQGCLIIITIGELPRIEPQPLRIKSIFCPSNHTQTIATITHNTVERYTSQIKLLKPFHPYNSEKCNVNHSLSQSRCNLRNVHRKKCNMMPEVIVYCGFESAYHSLFI